MQLLNMLSVCDETQEDVENTTFIISVMIVSLHLLFFTVISHHWLYHQEPTYSILIFNFCFQMSYFSTERVNNTVFTFQLATFLKIEAHISTINAKYNGKEVFICSACSKPALPHLCRSKTGCYRAWFSSDG